MGNGNARWSDGVKLASPSYNARLVGTVSVGTGLTNVLTVNVPSPGTYTFTANLFVVHSATTGFTVTPGFTGTVGNDLGVCITRYTAAAVAVSLHSTFTASPSSVWIKGEILGSFTATSAGNITIGCTRTGGTSSIVQAGSYITVDEVEV